MNIEMIVTAVIAFLAGTGIGFFIGRGSMAKTVEHSAEVEAKLGKAEQEVDEYRHQVKNHFEKTAELVGDLTNSYRDMTQHYKKVYEHLALGAQTLAKGDADMMIAASTIEKLIYEADEDAHVARIGTAAKPKPVARQRASKASDTARKKIAGSDPGKRAATKTAPEKKTRPEQKKKAGENTGKKPEKDTGEKPKQQISVAQIKAEQSSVKQISPDSASTPGKKEARPDKKEESGKR